MRIKIDKNSDTLYFRLDKNRTVESEEVQPGVVFDYDEDRRIVGVEFRSDFRPLRLARCKL